MLTRILFRQIGASSSIRLITSCRVLHKKRTPRAENAPIAHKLNSKQSFIVQHAKDYNLCVSAVPGSGKTTVAVAIMEGDPYRKTLIVTYSKLLQMETLDKATKRGLGRNSPIFTIHALAGKLAGETIMDDKTLESFLRRIESAPFTPKYRLDFDQIIVDEAQDLRLPHYRFTVALYNMVKEATRKSPRLIVMGDPKQAIYDYDGGDSRYLTHADTILKDVTPYKWKRVEMTETHRFGVPSAEFVNIQSDPRTVILGSLVGSQKRPIFMFVDNIYHSQRIAKALADMITQYRPHQTAILAPTQRADTPIAKLANTLALKYRIPISGLPDDDAELTVKTMRGKLVMSTYHKFKGRERDLVIVLGANGDWFHRYGISHPDDTLSNEHFVAFTRHKEQLVVIHDKRQPLLPNLTLDILRSTCEIVNLGNTPLSIPPYTPRTPEIQLRIPERVSVTDFLKHLSSEVVVNAAECYLQVHVLKTALPEHEHIKIPSEVATRKVGKIRHYEPVSDLTGVAITAAFEYEVTGECRTFRFVGDISDVPLDPDPRNKQLSTTEASAARSLLHLVERVPGRDKSASS
ncbi:hypothetical protein FRB91_004794 [Serendipita sp. 411]|nr:hypothetical protein FRB91_004794 [Serendipita sp. 411]